MRNIIYSLIASILMLNSKPAQIQSSEDPLIPPNNRFGIHISTEKDLLKAAQLVNSSGGEWGYITFVIREDEMDVTRWNNFMNQLQQLNLIPIVRLATTQTNSHWEKPTKEKAEDWTNFLNSLNWPTNNHYIILFNEPNHAKEWGNDINPQEYAQIARTYWSELNKSSVDFFILPAALDLAAGNTQTTMDAADFSKKMYEADNLIFTLFDGLNSHSYPNPNFCGNPKDTGRLSIQGYKWEIETLSQYHMPRNIPVFITETGWACPNQDLTNFYKIAFNEIWSDPQIVAVTPFLIDYDKKPFSDFSWTDPKTGNFRDFVQSIIDITKTKGEPEFEDDETKIIKQTLNSYLKNLMNYIYAIDIYEEMIELY